MPSPIAPGAPGGPLVAAARTLVRSLITALMLAGPAILPALAFASPPDPSWLAGIYDEADHDDVVVLVMSATGNIGFTVLASVQDLPPLVGGVPQTTEDASTASLRSPAHPRAPPLHASPLRSQ
jgi:hypothetical protein